MYELNKKWKKRIGGFLSKFFYVKLCFGRCYHSYLATFVGLLRDLSLITVGVKYFYPQVKLTIVIPVFVVFVVIMSILGHIEIKNKFAHLEMSVNNKINPELMSIYKRTKK